MDAITITDKDLAATGKQIEDCKRSITIDWEKLGSVVGVGFRCLHYFEWEIEEKLNLEGISDLDLQESEPLLKLFIDPNWIEKKTAEIPAQELG